MSDRYRVPKRKTPMRIRFAPNREEVISIFLAKVSANHAGPEKPLEFFNGSDEFIAAEAQAGNIVFIRRESIDVVTIDFDGELEGIAVGTSPIGTDLDIKESIAVEFADGLVLEGVTHYQLPEANSRLGDFLNGPPLFLPLYQSDCMHLLNKRRIARVSFCKVETPWRASIT